MVVFGSHVDFPDENPPFHVEPITDGYKFVFDNGQGKKSVFSINKNIVETLGAATGYTGFEGEAIETFRKYGKEKWPERFK